MEDGIPEDDNVECRKTEIERMREKIKKNEQLIAWFKKRADRPQITITIIPTVCPPQYEDR